MENEIEIGDRVAGGKGEDRDEGVVQQMRDERGVTEAYVGWDSGVCTWHPVSTLDLV